MNPERPTYQWRRMTAERREEALEYRRSLQLPWHSPPHYVGDRGQYLLTAACFEHQPIIGASPERMTGFKSSLLETVRADAREVFAWTILPNHYHALVYTLEIAALLKALGHLHGLTSYRWNGEDSRRGRQVWFRAAETAIKSERHFWATLNYVFHNAVRHGYVATWQDWPYTIAAGYLAEVGRDETERRWREYPQLGFGADWDPPDL